jgi:hypothetical protein
MPLLNTDVTSFIVLPVKTSVVSSANKIESIFSRYMGKSLMKIKKSKGPKTLPCGTPRFKRHFGASASLTLSC